MKETTVETPKTGKPALSWSFIDMLALLAVVGMVLFILFYPYDAYKKSLGKLNDAKARLTELTLGKNDELQRLKTQEELTEQLKKRKPDFSLFSYLNSVLTEKGIQERAALQEIKPRNDKKNTLGTDVAAMQLSLKGVSMKELVDLLYTIYASDNLIVMDRLDTLKASSDNRGIDCVIVLLTPKQSAKAT